MTQYTSWKVDHAQGPHRGLLLRAQTSGTGVTYLASFPASFCCSPCGKKPGVETGNEAKSNHRAVKTTFMFFTVPKSTLKFGWGKLNVVG